MPAQDYDALEARIKSGREEGASDMKVRNFRETIQEKWSFGLFGVEEHNIIPHNGESSNMVFDGLYHDRNTHRIVDLNNKYRESELFEADTIVSAEYTGNDWEFHKLPDYEMGEPLPGEK